MCVLAQRAAHEKCWMRYSSRWIGIVLLMLLRSFDILLILLQMDAVWLAAYTIRFGNGVAAVTTDADEQNSIKDLGLWQVIHCPIYLCVRPLLIFVFNFSTHSTGSCAGSTTTFQWVRRDRESGRCRATWYRSGIRSENEFTIHAYKRD